VFRSGGEAEDESEGNVCKVVSGDNSKADKALVVVLLLLLLLLLGL
jgi:hypothetical protein